MCSVHDTVEFEKRGVPSTTVITEAFRTAADFQFKGKGMEGHPYVKLPHPVSNLSADEMKSVTLGFVDEVAGQLKN
ncbi:MAG: hypothetical protein QF701_01955 [Nitrospinota bacterium]|nr:UGSC-containing protein [Nitrospinota bacterium]MDP7166514.1 hypothetical protein [Nitrospinota bacterium]MDP7371765.1 hypothetical protein [Nitrospinota bacterium]MDP7504732.1 hypothetical protein [Nitrospinota bacterium]